MNTITVVSYNIHKGMSPLNRILNLDGMAQALARLSPDILCLQEVQGRNLKRLASLKGYPSYSQHEWFGEYLSLSASYGKNCSYEHGHHGNATLSPHLLDPKHNVNITVNRLEKRGVLHCEIHPAGWDRPIVVLNAHLNLLHADRVRQYHAIIDYIRHKLDPKAPLILAGDFNDWSKKSASILEPLGLIEVFGQIYGDSLPTFPAVRPFLALDRIYVKNLSIHQATVHTGTPWASLSDHLPISAKLGLVA
ncbi:endonuclease/exonuclease/phosphatase family protein [Moraxella nasovis]|uniref:endonuclease/exonuclease/phosphatase family protein n=1 Tax=Moraxella nasovis TaxID=2904121 RepID=UPI001F615D9F|nr:endonuclease/exonuclease/phosphatase family protein [Moraxella nasovis]UNU72548.1 endonuclease/exonuclease/phosphatase family protein [Moraxella nasovis]